MAPSTNPYQAPKSFDGDETSSPRQPSFGHRLAAVAYALGAAFSVLVAVIGLLPQDSGEDHGSTLAALVTVVSCSICWFLISIRLWTGRGKVLLLNLVPVLVFIVAVTLLAFWPAPSQSPPRDLSERGGARSGSAC